MFGTAGQRINQPIKKILAFCFGAISLSMTPSMVRSMALCMICLCVGYLSACSKTDLVQARNPKLASNTDNSAFNSGSNPGSNSGFNSEYLSEHKAEQKKAALINIELGLNYLAQEQVARAKQKLIHALELAPKSVEPYSALAYFYEKTGDAVEAENAHKKALELAGGFKGRLKRGLGQVLGDSKLDGGWGNNHSKSSQQAALFNNYAAFLYRQHRYQEASQAFSIALEDKRYAHSAEVNENAGLCALKLLDFEAAEYYFNTAIQQDPKRIQASLELANLELAKNRERNDKKGKK